MHRSDDCQNDEEDKFVEVVDQDSEEDYEYWTLTVNNTYNFKRVYNETFYYHYIYVSLYHYIYISISKVCLLYH